MSVRAKFKLVGREEGCEGFSLKFEPVVSGSPENDQFFKYTPWGVLRLGIISADAAREFTVGDDYYLDFTTAPHPS